MTMTPPTTAPYGSWSSPISARLLAEAGVGLGGLQASHGHLFWLEMRPTEGGRYALVQRTPDGTISDVTPPEMNVRTLVHEYGGGSYTVMPGMRGSTLVIYSNFADQRLYRQDIAPDGSSSLPQPISRIPQTPRALRYADGRLTPERRSIICVREEHMDDRIVNDIALLLASPSGPDQATLEYGRDFYAAPRLSPDARTFAWLCWDFPAMPWDGTELWAATLKLGGLAKRRLIAGGRHESVLQPSFDAQGRLHFLSDRSGWWNLYRVDADPEAASAASATALAPLAAEFARSPWVFGLSSYAFLSDGRIICIYSHEGSDHLGLIDPEHPGVQPLPCEFTVMTGIVVTGDTIAVIGGSPTHSPAVALYDLETGALEVIRRSHDLELDPALVSLPEPIIFPTAYPEDSVHGPLVAELAALRESGGELLAHALYYAPCNPGFQGPADEKPPLIVMCHGGPTSAREAILNLEVQYWTSRGCAVVDVNYGGSTGYGRAYRERLYENWGIVDTYDCINAARYLVARGDVDPARLAIQGGSAGGYTTLNALARHDVFAAGASSFGISDLEDFVTGGTHKFESQYFLSLIGDYPEHVERYRERSPLGHSAEITVPVLLLQGLEDAIVPPKQAELIAAELRAQSRPFAYLAFAGEQHGFRQAETIVRATEATLSFYSRVFGFTPADTIKPLPLENLD